MPDFKAFLWPEAVAVIGASNDEHILRGALMKVMTKHDYAGKIYPVSRSETEVCGLKAYSSIDRLPGPVDLAVIVIPAKFVAETLEACGKAGIKAATIISSGFAEEVGGDGDAVEQQLREIAARYDMAVVGPNAEGFANTLNQLCPTFSPAMDLSGMPLVPDGRETGHIAVLAQSGGVGFAFFDRGRPKGLAFNYIVSTGNEACAEMVDLLDYMLEEGRTDVFILFMENIKNAEKFRATAAKALRLGKPIIVVKIGRSEAGVRAAMSHTAALAGQYGGYRAMFDRYGLIEAEEIEEAVDIAAGFSYNLHRLPAGKRVGITTGSGGAGGWMADTASLAGLTVPPLDAVTRARIDEHLPAYGTSQNPVDATAQAIRKLGNSRLTEWVAASNEVDAVIAITSARLLAGFTRDQEGLAEVGAAATKPTLFCSYTDPHPDAIAIAGNAGFAMLTNMRNCARTIQAMADYRQRRESFLSEPQVSTHEHHQAFDQVAAELNRPATVLCEYQAGPLLAAYGIPILTGRMVTDEPTATAAANSVDGSVALKLQSPDLPHKSDMGLVLLDVDEGDAASTGFATLMQRATDNAPDADVHGVLVQPMARPGLEMIVGVYRDETFGPIVSVGMGGVLVELLGDTCSGPAPISKAEAHRLVDGLKGRALLNGWRGGDAVDIDALVTVLVNVAHFAADHADTVQEIDLNPVLLHLVGCGLSVVDAMIVTR